MRGNRADDPLVSFAVRSIPAHAGEPLSGYVPSSLSRVYPRTCGGTSGVYSIGYSVTGLSPHMRGNPGEGLGRLPVIRSIPAHAGEP